MNGVSQDRQAEVRPVPPSNPDLQWSSKQLYPLSKQGVVSKALVPSDIQPPIWKRFYSSHFAQESHYSAKAQIWQARKREKILGVSPFKGDHKGNGET